MSWETDHYDLASCPCGKGKIVEARHSPDNGWSKPYSEVEISCADCSKAWDVNSSGGDLVHKASRQASRQADLLAAKASAAIISYLNELLAGVQLPSFKTMGEEFAYLTKAGLYVSRVGEYRYARRSAGMSDIAQVRNDSPIIPQLLKKGDSKEYEALLRIEKAAREDALEKDAAIQYFSLHNVIN